MFVSPQKIATSMMALSSAIPSPSPADDYQTVPSESVPAAYALALKNTTLTFTCRVVPLLKEIEQIMNAVLVPDVEGDDYENDYVGESKVAKEESQLIQTNERLKREIASTRALANHQLESYYASLIKREMLLSNDIKTKTVRQLIKTKLSFLYARAPSFLSRALPSATISWKHRLLLSLLRPLPLPNPPLLLSRIRRLRRLPSPWM